MRIQKDPIRLRHRLCKDGSKSLYLDIYMNGVRRYEYLKLYLIPEKNAKDKQKNRETLRLAEAVRAREIKARNFDRDSINRDEFVCPTCHRKLEESNIDEQIDKMEGNYNAETSRLLDENKKKGLSVKAKRATITQNIADIEEKVKEISGKLETLRKDPYCDAVFDEPDTSHVDDNVDVKNIQKEIETADNEIRTHIVAEPSTGEIKTKRAQLQNEINELNVRLGNKAIIERNNARIEELENQYKEQVEQITELEGYEQEQRPYKRGKE